VLLPDQDWQIVSQGHKFTEGLTANEKGEVFFVEIPGEQIFKVGLDGKVTLFKDKSGRVKLSSHFGDRPVVLVFGSYT